MSDELVSKALVLEVLNAYIDHIASPNECELIREIKTEVLRMRANRWLAFSNEEMEWIEHGLWCGKGTLKKSYEEARDEFERRKR